jgi:hypothetical protein
MATLAVSGAGGGLTYVAANAGGDEYPNTGSEKLHVVNGGGAPITVTLTAQGTCNHGFLHDKEFTVDDGDDKLIPAQLPSRFNNENDRVEVEYSAVTSVTVAVLG